MNLAIHRGDGTNISNQEFIHIQRSANIVCDQLINRINSDPRSIVLLGNSQIKTTLKKVFHTEYDQAILTLEAQQQILCLCSAHWKVDAMLGEALLWQSEAEAKAMMNDAVSASSKSSRSDTKVF